MEIYYNPDTQTITMVLENMTITTHAHVDMSLGDTIAKMLTDVYLQTNRITPFDQQLTDLANQIKNHTKNAATGKDRTMKVFRHPRNGVIIATTDTHAIYVPLPMGMAVETQLQDADYHLTNETTRCFVLCDDPGKEVVPAEPAPDTKKQDLEPTNTDKN